MQGADDMSQQFKNIGKPFLKSGQFVLALPVLGGKGENADPVGWGTFLGNFLFKGGQNACQNGLCTFKFNLTM